MENNKIILTGDTGSGKTYQAIKMPKKMVTLHILHHVGN